MSDKHKDAQGKILPCPFCGGAASIDRDGDWLLLVAKHSDDCILDGGDQPEMTYMASPISHAEMSAKWNRRATEGQAQTSATVDCPACDGKGGWVTAEWTDPVSGPECEGERCGDCEGTGKVAAQLADSTAPGAPELPEPRILYEADRETITGYDADQMRAYRLAAPTAQQSTAGGAVPDDATVEAMKAVLFSGKLVDTFMIYDLYRAALAAAPLMQVQPSEALDAARYRWLTETNGLRFSPSGRLAIRDLGEMNEFIDAAIADQQPVTPSGALADNDGGVA